MSCGLHVQAFSITSYNIAAPTSHVKSLISRNASDGGESELLEAAG